MFWAQRCIQSADRCSRARIMECQPHRRVCRVAESSFTTDDNPSRPTTGRLYHRRRDQAVPLFRSSLLSLPRFGVLPRQSEAGLEIVRSVRAVSAVLRSDHFLKCSLPGDLAFASNVAHAEIYPCGLLGAGRAPSD